MTKTGNLAGLTSSQQSVDASLAAIQQALNAGFATTRIEATKIGANIVRLLTDQNITIKQLEAAQQAVLKLGIPKDWKAAGLTHRLWSLNQFRRSEGQVMLFLLANTPPGFDLDNKFLVRNDAGKDVNVSVKGVGSKFIASGFLDIQTRRLISLPDAKLLAATGVDNGKLDLTSNRLLPRTPTR